MKNITGYAKALIAALGAAASVLTALDVHATWVTAVVAMATAFGVYAVPNKAAKAKPAPVVTTTTGPVKP